ncbi:MAG: outer membrane lipoprotein carrier protein LolA [Bacteroidota bacterium]
MYRLFSLVIVLFCLSILSVEHSYAQNADAILATSRKKVESLGDMQAKFTYSMSSARLRPVSRSGKLYYKKGKYRVHISGQRIISNKVTKWLCLPEDGEVIKSSVADGDGPNPGEMFNVYKSKGKTSYMGTKTVHGIACHQIQLSLDVSNLDYNKAYLSIDKRTNLPVKVSIVDRKNTTTTYELFDLKTNSGLTDNIFVFKQADCPDCDVVVD